MNILGQIDLLIIMDPSMRLYKKKRIGLDHVHHASAKKKRRDNAINAARNYASLELNRKRKKKDRSWGNLNSTVLVVSRNPLVYRYLPSSQTPTPAQSRNAQEIGNR